MRKPGIIFLAAFLALFAIGAYACISMPDPVYLKPSFINLTAKPDKDAGTGIYSLEQPDLIHLIDQYKPGYEEVWKKQDESYWSHIINGKIVTTELVSEIGNMLASKNIRQEQWEEITKKNLTLTYDSYIYYFDPTSACRTNSKSNALEFLKTAFADPSMRGGYLELAKARVDILAICYVRDVDIAAINTSLDELEKQNSAGAYPQYLRALVYFYSQDYDKAVPIFESLAKQKPIIRKPWMSYFRKLFKLREPSQWLAETSQYMIGRTHLVKAQKSWNGYQIDDKINQQELKLADIAYRAYAAEYPNGLYIDSSRNILRKIFLLANRQDELNKILKTALNSELDKKTIPTPQKVNEFYRYFDDKPDIRNDNALVSAILLLKSPKIPDGALADLEASKQKFNDYPGLFVFSKALILYRSEQYKDFLAQIPAEKLEDTQTSLAVEAMRADSYEKIGNMEAASNAWSSLNKAHEESYAQMRLAALYANEHKFSEMLADKNLPEKVQSDFLAYAASDHELESLPDNDLVRQELMKRYLLQADYKKLSELMGKGGKLGIYAKIANESKALVGNPNEPRALTEVAAFMYYNSMTPGNKYQDQIYSGNLYELIPYCKSCGGYVNSPTVKLARSPYKLFSAAEAQYKNNSVKNDDEAKTLYFLVRCFRGGEFQVRCKWSDGEKNNSKVWYNRLHNLYPSSSWAKKTQFYY